MGDIAQLTQVAPGISRIELRIRLLPGWPSIGLRVNSYVLETPDGLCLVDCGPLGLYSRLRALVSSAFPRRKVIRVYLTHSHFDHAGAGLRCINEGIEVWAAEEEQHILRAGGPTGVPKVFRYPEFTPTHLLEPGHTIVLSGGHQLEAVLTPGHTPGSVCFHGGQAGTLLYGDCLFGPLGGYAVTLLLEYLTSLRQPAPELHRQVESLGLLGSRLAQDEHTLMLPGHGAPYYLDEHPGAFRRSIRLLRWAIRLKRALPGSGRSLH